MLDEKALRRPGFDEAASVPIVLSDGQTWRFPRPIIDLFPIVEADGSVEPGGRRTFGPDFDRMMEELRQVEGSTLDEIRLIMRVAVDLLRRNYDIPPEGYRDVLRYRPGDPENHRLWQSVIDVALGNDSPKPSGDGSASSSSPTASTPAA